VDRLEQTAKEDQHHEARPEHHDQLPSQPPSIHLHRRHGFDPFDVFICRECGMWQPRRTSVVLGA